MDTVEPCLMATPLIWSPLYYGHTILAWTKAWSLIFMFSRLFTVPYFSVRLKISIFEFDGLPHWSLDASKTGESTKYLWVGVVDGMAGKKNRETPYFFCPLHSHVFNHTTPTHRHFVFFPVWLASRDQDGARQTERSTAMTSWKSRGRWTVNIFTG